MSESWWFSGWNAVLRTAVVGVAAYAAVVVLLRVGGKRTLTKLNAFDFVVTVALGSTLGSILTSRDVTVAQGAVAFGTLVALERLVSFASSRFGLARRVLKSEPALLVRDGEILEDVLLRERIARDEVLAALRGAGASSARDVTAVVLETDGSISVVRGDAEGEALRAVMKRAQQG